MSLTELFRTYLDDRVVERTDEGEFIEKDADGISLKGVLQRGRIRLGKERRPYPKGVSFRPSDLTFNYCKRIKIAQLAGLVDLFDPKPTPRQQLVFDVGHAYHDIIQRYFWDIGQLKGTYKCKLCDKFYHDLVSPTQCPEGHERKWMKYKEVVYRDEQLLINGRADGIIVIEGEDHLLDIKSIANRTVKTPEQQFCFEDLEHSGPKPEHVVQIMLYMYMSGIHKGHLFYVGKNNQQIKTYAIPYDYSVLAPYLQDIRSLIRKAAALKQGHQVELPEPCSRKDCTCEDFLGNKK